MTPNLIINYYAIAACVLAGMIFGFLWYGPLFGKVWGRLMGMPADYKPEPKVFGRALLLQAIGLVLISYVMAHAGQIWRPSVWGVGPDEASNFMWGFMAAFFTWIGFYIPMQLGKVAWENRPWQLFFINAGHDFLNLLIISVILAYWR
jgi:hypothetical protein